MQKGSLRLYSEVRPGYNLSDKVVTERRRGFAQGRSLTQISGLRMCSQGCLHLCFCASSCLKTYCGSHRYTARHLVMVIQSLVVGKLKNESFCYHCLQLQSSAEMNLLVHRGVGPVHWSFSYFLKFYLALDFLMIFAGMNVEEWCLEDCSCFND